VAVVSLGFLALLGLLGARTRWRQGSQAHNTRHLLGRARDGIDGRDRRLCWHRGLKGWSCPLWVISRHNGRFASCTLYPRERTFVSAGGMSELKRYMLARSQRVSGLDVSVARAVLFQIDASGKAEQPPQLASNTPRKRCAKNLTEPVRVAFGGSPRRCRSARAFLSERRWL
jgi:hypothetical protein